MPRKHAVDFDKVREIGLTMDGVKESTTYRFPALKVGLEVLVCLPD